MVRCWISLDCEEDMVVNIFAGFIFMGRHVPQDSPFPVGKHLNMEEASLKIEPRILATCIQTRWY